MSEKISPLRGRVRNAILAFVVQHEKTHANEVARLYHQLCDSGQSVAHRHQDAPLVWARVHLHQLKRMGYVTSNETQRPSGSKGRGRYVEWRPTEMGKQVVNE